MVHIDTSLSWLEFPSEAEPETRIFLQVAPRSNKKIVFSRLSISFLFSAQ